MRWLSARVRQRQQVEAQRQQQRQDHHDQRQDRVHPRPHVLERGEVGQPPVAEADRHLGAQVRGAGDVDVGRARRSSRARSGSPARPARCSPGASRFDSLLLPPARLGGEQHLVLAVGDRHLDPRPPPALLVQAEIDGHHHHAEQLLVDHHLAGVVEALGAVVVLDDRELGAVARQRQGCSRPCRRRTARAGARRSPPRSAPRRRAGRSSRRRSPRGSSPAAPRRRRSCSVRSAMIRIGSRESRSGTTAWRCIVLWIEPA